MAFLTEPEFRSLEITASATEITPDVVNDLLRKAKDRLIEWCGESVVQDVEAANDTNALKTRRFRDAQQLIGKAQLCLWVASRYRSGGIQVSEKDQNDSATNTYEKYSDAKKRHDDLIAEAKETVEAYLVPTEEIPDETSGFINYSTTVSRKPVW